MSEHIQVVVIGAGPGGYTAAFYAADCGLSVCLIEKESALGGVCLNRGCVPSKTLLHAVSLMDETKRFKEHGLGSGDFSLNLEGLREFKNSTVEKLGGGVRQLAKMRGVKIIQAEAKFIARDTLECTSKDGVKQITFDHAIIATGSAPFTPPALRIDSDRVMDSTSALELKRIPKSLLVIGGGVIGLELGSVYSALGSEVTLIEATGGLVPGVDKDLLQPVLKKLKTEFASIQTKTLVESLEEKEDGIHVSLKNLKTEESRSEVFDGVLMCIGRKPNSSNLGLENCGVELDEGDFILVYEEVMTTNPKIYAIGDVCGNPMLAHKASREGKLAVDCIKGLEEPVTGAIPSVIYTDPEIAWVGLTETEAKLQKIPFKKCRFPWAASGRAMSMGRTDGVTKILAEPETGKILGGGITGAHAGELIGELTLALKLGASVHDLADTIHAHPTLSETLMESAESFEGKATHMFSR